MPSGKVATGDAFEDVLYGSESELDESDDEAQAQRGSSSKGKGNGHGLRLRVDDDEPMDLLQGAVSRITSTSHANFYSILLIYSSRRCEN